VRVLEAAEQEGIVVYVQGGVPWWTWPTVTASLLRQQAERVRRRDQKRPEARTDRLCLHCGKKFTAGNSRGVYCCDHCRRAAYWKAQRR